jgi:hypothetical protein
VLLLLGQGSPRQIAAGVATVTLSSVTASLTDPHVFVAGVATIRLSPETAAVTVTAVPVVVIPTAAETLALALSRGHQPRARVVTLTAALVERTAYNPAAIALDGTVTFDRNRNVRRFTSMRLVDQDGSLSPSAAGDEFAPGQTVRIERGARVGGVNIYDLLGTFEVKDFSADMAGTFSFSGEDTSLALVQDFGEVVTIPSGTSAEDALLQLWEPVLGSGASWALDGGGMALGSSRSFTESEQRLTSAVTLMADMGLEVYMGRDGAPVLKPLVDPNSVSPTRTYTQTPGQALAVSLSRHGEFRSFNRQVVIGEAPERPAVRGVADITDPTSPLHRDRIGLRVAPVYRSAQITTTYQARAVAKARLIEQSLWSDAVEWSGVPDPTVEAGDVVRIVEAQTGTDAAYRVDSVTIPVAQGPMRMTASLVVPLFEAA